MSKDKPGKLQEAHMAAAPAPVAAAAEKPAPVNEAAGLSRCFGEYTAPDKKTAQRHDRAAKLRAKNAASKSR